MTADSSDTRDHLPPLIDVRDLTKVYGTGPAAVWALRGVSFQVHEGEFVALMGPSGSGKSTFLHLLGCLNRPTSGSYRLAGPEVAHLTRDELAAIRNRRIGFVFQNLNLLPRTSALENVELPLLYAGVMRDVRRPRAAELLESVGLGGRLSHRPNELSGGEQQRVAIARALANSAPFLLADEPTGNLDSASSREIMAVFRHPTATRGTTIVLVTHDPAVARWADRIVMLQDGRVLHDQPVTPEVTR